MADRWPLSADLSHTGSSREIPVEWNIGTSPLGIRNVTIIRGARQLHRHVIFVGPGVV